MGALLSIMQIKGYNDKSMAPISQNSVISYCLNCITWNCLYSSHHTQRLDYTFFLICLPHDLRLR